MSTFEDKIRAQLERLRQQEAEDSTEVSQQEIWEMEPEQSVKQEAVDADMLPPVSGTGQTSLKRVREDGTPTFEPETQAKKAKEAIPCTCAVSSDCQLAARNGVEDCRRALGPIPRKSKATKGPLVAPTKPKAVPSRPLSTKQLAKAKRSKDEILEILNIFNKAKMAQPGARNPIFNQMRNHVQQLPFCEAHPSHHAEIKRKFADPMTGLPAIINSNFVPWDIKLDIDMIRMRWEKGDVEIDLDRGLITKSGKTVSRSLDPSYEFKVSCIYVGEGNLRNGQWFPWQLSALRDGAHGETEAGICGRTGLGAVSIILSSGSAYADRDEGETITYFGTHGKDGQISGGTCLLLESAKKQNDIRVLRSSKLPAMNKYRPAVGFRYDGLYRIVDHELRQPETMLYCFKLARVEGQTPIRYSGPEARPNQREIDGFKRLQKFMSKSHRD